MVYLVYYNFHISTQVSTIFLVLLICTKTRILSLISGMAIFLLFVINTLRQHTFTFQELPVYQN